MSEVEVEYVEEAGPGIPELPADVQFGGEPAPDALPAEVLPQWEEQTIRQILTGTGAGVHMLAGKAERDWLMTEKDLERIAPPLTRIMNRYEPTARLSPYADPLLVAHGFALYGWRSALERQRALKDQAAEQPEGPRAAYVQSGYEPPDEDGFEEARFVPTEDVQAPQAMFPQAVRRRS